MKSTIDRLIINSPYEEPAHYWSYDRETRFFTLKDGRRPAGYVIASESSKAFDDPGKFIEIPLVNNIRLLEHWRNPEEREYRRFFFCQLEAIETLIWLIEAPEAERVGIEIPTRRRVFQAPLLQDGDRKWKNYRNGYAHCMAGIEQSHLSAGYQINRKTESGKSPYKELARFELGDRRKARKKERR